MKLRVFVAHSRGGEPRMSRLQTACGPHDGKIRQDFEDLLHLWVTCATRRIDHISAKCFVCLGRLAVVTAQQVPCVEGDEHLQV